MPLRERQESGQLGVEQAGGAAGRAGGRGGTRRWKLRVSTGAATCLLQPPDSPQTDQYHATTTSTATATTVTITTAIIESSSASLYIINRQTYTGR